MSLSKDKLLVFVVDDEPIIASTVAMILESKGFDAKPFTNPIEALAAAWLHAPDLLISDVVMPELSGVDLAIQVKGQCPDCKVLLFSGQAATADLLETARAIGYDFELLSRPVHPTDLLKSIQNLIEVTPAIAPRGEMQVKV
jgi:DNA-binding NtrC family response regulator